jgi:undecaprenyl-diphosphatase
MGPPVTPHGQPPAARAASVGVVLLTAMLLFGGVALADDPATPADPDPPPSPTASDMALWQAAVLGIVEGLTEYLPVSSTGHLLVVQNLMGLGGAGEADEEAAKAYAICIQAGAIVAVLGLYWRRVGQAFRGFRGDRLGRRLQANLLAGFVPAAILGLLFNDLIKQYLFGPWPVVVAWFVGGVVILAVARRRKRRGAAPRTGVALDELTWKLALIIGFAQCIAMWPGVSRSLITIVGGVLVGLSLPAAVEFSFLLGVVTLGAATAYDAVKHGPEMAAAYSPASLILGMILALASAAIAVKWMVAYLNKHSMAIFGYYRIAIAIAVAALLLAGILHT